jgi:hypothetical protein
MMHFYFVFLGLVPISIFALSGVLRIFSKNETDKTEDLWW